ncbi:hypothetical protein IWZ01DRAFT_502497 [Phyllosticta capitalensis]
MSVPRVPPELLLSIIESIQPTNVALPPTDITTHTIRSLTLVSRLTYPCAIRSLYSHCLWIDSSDRLRKLLLSLQALSEPNRRQRSSLPCVEILPCLTGLFLAPFPQNTIDDWPTAQWTFELLSIMRQTLVRLVIDIPLRSLYPPDDHLSVRPRLRAAFEQLQRIEEFTSTRDELYLDTIEWYFAGPLEPPAWRGWSNLRRLALYNFDHHRPEFYDTLQNLPSLECIALTRAEWPAAASMWPRFAEKAKQHDLKILSLDVEGGGWTITGLTDSPHWRPALQSVKGCLGQELQIHPISVSLPFYCKPGNALDFCQEWVRDRALRGDLWSLESSEPLTVSD